MCKEQELKMVNENVGTVAIKRYYLTREEFELNGLPKNLFNCIYFLFDNTVSDSEKAYIGSTGVRSNEYGMYKRLKEHSRKDSPWWKEAICYSLDDSNEYIGTMNDEQQEEFITNLEKNLIEEAVESGSVVIANIQIGKSVMSRDDKEALIHMCIKQMIREDVQNMQSYLFEKSSSLLLDICEGTLTFVGVVPNQKDKIIHMDVIIAGGKPKEFIIRKGSYIVTINKDKELSQKVLKLVREKRREILEPLGISEGGIAVQLKEDVYVPNITAVGTFIFGRGNTANKNFWKLENDSLRKKFESRNIAVNYPSVINELKKNQEQ